MQSSALEQAGDSIKNRAGLDHITFEVLRICLNTPATG